MYICLYIYVNIYLYLYLYIYIHIYICNTKFTLSLTDTHTYIYAIVYFVHTVYGMYAKPLYPSLLPCRACLLVGPLVMARGHGRPHHHVSLLRHLRRLRRPHLLQGNL